MKKLFLFSVVLISLGQFVQADIIGKIEEVAKDKSRVKAKLNNGIDLSDHTMIQINHSCDLKLISQNNNTAILSTETCLNLSNVKIGKSLESESSNSKSNSTSYSASQSIKEIKKDSTLDSIEKSSRVYSGLLASAGIASHSMEVNSFSSDTNSEALNLKIGYGNTIVGKVGFLGFATIGKKITNSDWISYSYLRNEGSLVVSNEKIYGLFGLNLIKYIDTLNFPDDIGLGFQMGGGIKINNKIAINFQYAQNSVRNIRLEGLESGMVFSF